MRNDWSLRQHTVSDFSLKRQKIPNPDVYVRAPLCDHNGCFEGLQGIMLDLIVH